nr:TIGR03862 family flavoprotein [Xenophilus sp. Marseille-Q4582]
MKRVAVIGGGPAGLMAAQQLADAGCEVDLFDAMPSVGRKFLLAGRGGLNLTHSEPFEAFAGRYASRRPQIEPLLRTFDAQALRDWVHGLGVQTFVGSSGRVFPIDMKAAPLLRAWLHRLREAGVRFHMRHRWLGWAGTGAHVPLQFESPEGRLTRSADAVVLALGGASWPRLGSDGGWVPVLEARGVPVAPLRPANCGFDVAAWTPFFAERFAGQPFKSVAVRVLDAGGEAVTRKGEFVATATGVEGSVVYAVSALLRDRIAAHGTATLWVDLLPDRSEAQVLAAVRHPRGSRSLGSHLKSRLGVEGIKSALLHELLPREQWQDPLRIAQTLKAAPIELVAARPVAEAISTAGGVAFEALDGGLMLQAMPGVFVAGEMLDWEAPTGGYLLTACMASGVVAAQGARRWLGMAAD